MARIFALLILMAAVSGAAAGERFPILQPDQMNADQKKLLEALLAGPRGGGNTSPEAVQKMLGGGPFNAWMRSPDLGNRLQNVGEYIRYRTSLPLRLNEFAILITAREWTSQYEWYAHYRARHEGGPGREGRRRACAQQAAIRHERRRSGGLRVLHPASPHPERRRRDVQPRACAVRRAGCGRSDRRERLLRRRLNDAQCRARDAAGRHGAAAQVAAARRGE